MDANAGGDGGAGPAISALSDDLLAQCFAVLDDGTLRVAAGTCRRWAALLRDRAELFRSVRFDLPPKRSRGRDRQVSARASAPFYEWRSLAAVCLVPSPGRHHAWAVAAPLVAFSCAA